MKFRKIFFSLLVGLILISGSTLAYQEMIIKNVKVEGVSTKPVRVIKIVLDGQDFVINSLATTGGDTLQNLMDKVGGHTAINGIFFCPAGYSYCNGETFSNFERIFNGQVDEQSRYWPDTGVRGIFGFEKDGTPLFVQNNLSEMPGIWADTNKDKINDFYFGLGNFPILVLHGENVVQYSADYLDEKLSGRQNRQFICSSQDGKTVYMGVVGLSNMYETADIMIKAFGCYHGINLDAGESTNMIYNNHTLQHKKRKIMDARVVVDREQYKNITQLSDDELPELDPYLPDNYEELTKKNKENIEKLGVLLSTIIKERGDTFKREFITVVRRLASKPEIKNDPQKKRLLNELLILLFSIGN